MLLDGKHPPTDKLIDKRKIVLDNNLQIDNSQPIVKFLTTDSNLQTDKSKVAEILPLEPVDRVRAVLDSNPPTDPLTDKEMADQEHDRVNL